VSQRSQEVAALVQRCQGGDLDARYLAFFECFNRQLFFEAHEVLEGLWRPQRGTARGLFYKGLIQLAGAFVHVQKNRFQPAAALFELARVNLRPYTPVYERLEVDLLLKRIDEWLDCIRDGGPSALFRAGEAPILTLFAA